MNNRILEVLEKYKNLPNFFILNNNNFINNVAYSLSLDELTDIRTAHGLNSNVKIWGIFYFKQFMKGDFFSNDRNHKFSTCILEDRFSFAGVEETTGWAKNEDATIEIYYNEIKDIITNFAINLEQEKAKPYSFFY